MAELQALLDEWIVAVCTDRGSADTGSDLRLFIEYMSATLGGDVAVARLGGLVQRPAY